MNIIDKIQKELTMLSTKCYFNNAGAGLMPNCVYETIIEELNYELCSGRVNSGQRKRFQKYLEDLRCKLSSLISSKSSEIAITNNTTDGINIIMWGLNLVLGDEILTTTCEHLGALASLSTLSRQKGVNIRFYTPVDNQFDIDLFFSLVTPKTKVIVISHIFWNSGTKTPIKEICKRAHELNILVLVDGAQAVGAIPINIKDLDADFYVFPAHKWLQGPEGIGVLYIKDSLLYIINQIFAGNASFKEHDGSIFYLPSAGSKRFEIGTRFRPIIWGFINGLHWLQNDIGMENIFLAIKRNTDIVKEMLAKEIPVNPVANHTVNIITLPLPKDKNCKEIVKELEKEKIYVREIKEWNALRISVGFYNSFDQIEKLIYNLNKLFFKEQIK